MKISGQDVPPELAALYAAYVSPLVRAATPQAYAKTRRAALMTKTARQRKKKDLLHLFMPAARGLAFCNNFNAADPSMSDWLKARATALRAATVEAQFWYSQTPNNTQNHTITPSAVDDPTPPPYTYRDPSNLPSIMTYGTGSTTSLGLRYAGSTTSGRFKDTNLRWTDCKRNLLASAADPEKYPVLLFANYTITATANARGSRPMFSYLIRFRLEDTSTWLSSDNTPPSKSDRSMFYPYEPPLGASPYYSATLARPIIIVPRKKHISATPMYARAKIAIRPLFGRGFNNNTTITVTATGSATFLEPIRAGIANDRQVRTLGGTLYTKETANPLVLDTWDITPWHLILAVTSNSCLIEDDTGAWKWATWKGSLSGAGITQFDARIQGGGGLVVMIVYTGPDSNSPAHHNDYIAYVASTGAVTASRNFAVNALAGLTKTMLARLSGGMILTTDGEQQNLDFGSRWVLPWATSGAPVMFDASAYYVQRDTGQWYRFFEHANRGGYYGDGTQPQALTPSAAIGTPTPVGHNYTRSIIGICWQDSQINGPRWRVLNWIGNEGIALLPETQPGVLVGYQT